MNTPIEIKSGIEPLRVSSSRVALARAVGFITDRNFAHCRVAQPGFLGNLRLRLTPLMRSDRLPPSLVLFSWTVLF